MWVPTGRRFGPASGQARGLTLREAVKSALMPKALDQVPAQRRRAPILFNVLDHQFRSLVVRNIGAIVGIVHGIGKIANEHAVNSPSGHLLDGEGSIENAHVGMNSHDQKIFDSALREETVNLPAVRRNDVVPGNAEGGALTRPRLVKLVCRIASTICIVDRQRRVGQVQTFGRVDGRNSEDESSLRVLSIEAHYVGRGVNDLDAVGSGLIDDRRHFACEDIHPGRRSRAPVLVPHVADHDGRGIHGEVPFEVNLAPVAAAFERLDPGAQMERQGSLRGLAKVGLAPAPVRSNTTMMNRQDAGRLSSKFPPYTAEMNCTFEHQFRLKPRKWNGIWAVNFPERGMQLGSTWRHHFGQIVRVNAHTTAESTREIRAACEDGADWKSCLAVLDYYRLVSKRLRLCCVWGERNSGLRVGVRSSGGNNPSFVDWQ